MLSGKRQHWVGLSKKSRKKLEHFPFKDFAILVLIAIIITMAWTWYDNQQPMTPQWVEHQRGLEELRIMRASGATRNDLTDDSIPAQRSEMSGVSSDLARRLKVDDLPAKTHQETLEELRAMRRQ